MTEPTPTTPRPTYAQVTDEVLAAMRMPRPAYYLVLLMLAGGSGTFFSGWVYQVKMGMGVTGLNIPVGWGVYIANFVFWVGIAHSGTLISAILHLVRSKWCSAVSRSAEAMTVFAVMTAGLFPLIHLGRVWVVYYIIPYPSQRQLWPDFLSPLVWDVVAVSTYLTVSTIFWYVGLIPDLASSRDRWLGDKGPDSPRFGFYRRLSTGWYFAGSQWRHYGRAYLFFAALATPLVISVHSVVSWDFAMSNLPGWHTTIFAPYFVAGAIHSGLAMVLTLLIPMRKILGLQKTVTMWHFGAIAKTIVVTTLIVGYAYMVEPLMSWYSGDTFEGQFAWWRATGWLAWCYWALFAFNVLIPLTFLSAKARANIWWLFIVSICVNIGMWLERFFIVVGSLSHDFMPHNWAQYCPSWVEITITIGSFTFFLFWFFIFAKLLPTVATYDVKEVVAEEEGQLGHEDEEAAGVSSPSKGEGGPQGRVRVSSGVLAVFTTPNALVEALKRAKDSAFAPVEFFTPFRLPQAEQVLGWGHSPVRFWTLAGALSGLIGGFWLAIGSAAVNDLTAGGKFTPAAVLPYCIIAFEGTVLLGTIFNLLGVFIHCRLGRSMKAPPLGYDERFGKDRFGMLLKCAPAEVEQARAVALATKPEEVHVVS